MKKLFKHLNYWLIAGLITVIGIIYDIATDIGAIRPSYVVTWEPAIVGTVAFTWFFLMGFLAGKKWRSMHNIPKEKYFHMLDQYEYEQENKFHPHENPNISTVKAVLHWCRFIANDLTKEDK